MKIPPFTLTNESVTVVWEGRPHVVQKAAANFLNLRQAIIDERWEDVPKNLTVAKSVNAWAQGKFDVDDGLVCYGGEPLPAGLSNRIVWMASCSEDPTSLFRFWEKLQLNPSKRSVEQLWSFLDQRNIPITDDGDILAYKSVQADLMDHHTGTFENRPGVEHQLPRNRVSDDPSLPCEQGFHVGALEYVQNYGGPGSRIVICRVNPADVVCVPNDADCQKMRVCRYRVEGFYSGQPMPSTSVTTEKVGKKRGKKTKLNDMDTEELMGETLENLRKYASGHLSIVGASRILGGKLALVAKILEVRGYVKMATRPLEEFI